MLMLMLMGGLEMGVSLTKVLSFSRIELSDDFRDVDMVMLN